MNQPLTVDPEELAAALARPVVLSAEQGDEPQINPLTTYIPSPGAWPPSFLGLEGPYRDVNNAAYPYYFIMYASIFTDFVHKISGSITKVSSRRIPDLTGMPDEDCTPNTGSGYYWFVVRAWSSAVLWGGSLRDMEFKFAQFYHTGTDTYRFTGDSPWYQYHFQWATTMPAGTILGVGPIEPTPNEAIYRRRIYIRYNVRPGLIGTVAQLLYRINDGPTVYEQQVAIGQFPLEIPPGQDFVQTSVYFDAWSLLMKTTNVTSVQLAFIMKYDEPDVTSPGSQTVWMDAPGNVPTIRHVTWYKTGDPSDPFYMIYNVTTPMPYNYIQWESSYNGSGMYPRTGRLPMPQRLGGSYDWPNGEAAFEWLTHNIWAERIRVRTDFNGEWVSSWSANIDSNTPLLWPYVLNPGIYIAHVREVVCSWTARNYGRPTKVGTFLTHNSQTPNTTLDWALTSKPEWGDGSVYITAGVQTDGPHTFYVSSAALVDGVETWGWYNGVDGNVAITVTTKPTISQLELVPSSDRLDRWVEMSFQCPVPTTSFQVERRLDVGSWEVIASTDWDVLGKLSDTYAAGHVFTYQDQNVVIADGSYWYRGRAVYRASDTVSYDGTWSDEADLRVDVNFNLIVDEIYDTIKGYDDAIFMGVWHEATSGEPVDFVTLWVKQDSATEYVSLWQGPPTIEAGRWYVETPSLTFAKNTCWSYTFTDGARKPIETDRYETVCFSSTITLDVEDYVLIGAPDDGA